MENYVYFMEDGEYIKIGVSTDPTSRLRQIQTGNPRPIGVWLAWGYCSAKNAFQTEAWLHARFADKQTIGEWFKLDKADRANIINQDFST